MDRVELVKKLDLVGRALATNDMVQIMKCFAFTGTEVIADNDALAIVSPCETTEKFVVNGQVLLGLLSASSSEEVDFTIDGYEVIVRAGRSTFKLPFQSIEDFPFQRPEIKKWDVITTEIEGLEPCLETSSKDLTQLAFAGVLLNGKLYSSDGDALTSYTLSHPPKQLQPYMMSTQFCDTVLRIGEKTEAEMTTIFLAPGWACAKIGSGGSGIPEYEVWGKLLDPPPVDFEEKIAEMIGGTIDVVTIPKGLEAALKRARVIADPEGKPTQLTVTSNGKLKIVTDNSLGVVSDVLPFAQHEVTALVSAQLMQRSIRLTHQMLIFENCCIFTDIESQLFILLSTFG